MGESSTKPYLIRALHEWCTDNGYTPYIVVQVSDRTMVPPAHVRDGQITLNIGNLATNKLSLGNDFIEFQARFSGITETVSVPVGSVSAIYARETGAGMGFEVQTEEEEVGAETRAPQGRAIEAAASPEDTPAPNEGASPDDEPTPPRPRLTIVK
jgi:stringent starvation protein B